MGTNFYFFTKNKTIKENYFGCKTEITDFPDFGYQIHIAKTSYGWLPLFEAHEHIRSVKDLKKVYSLGDIIIYDEYGKEYSWDEFKERVIDFNGGTVIKRVKKPIKSDADSPYADSNCPKWTPISHFEYTDMFGNCPFVNAFYDDEMYEFDEDVFS